MIDLDDLEKKLDEALDKETPESLRSWLEGKRKNPLETFVRLPIYDKKGREILVGDTLKVFHFIGKRKKKYYMYKYVYSEVTFGERNVPYFRVKHLNNRDGYYHLLLNGKKYEDMEIVQGYGYDGTHFEDRPKAV